GPTVQLTKADPAEALGPAGGAAATIGLDELLAGGSPADPAAPPEAGGAAQPEAAGAAGADGPGGSSADAPTAAFGAAPSAFGGAAPTAFSAAASAAFDARTPPAPGSWSWPSGWPGASAGFDPRIPPPGQPLPPAGVQLRDRWEQERARRTAQARRGRITEIVAHSVLFLTWFTLGMLSFAAPIPVQAFLWCGLGILLAAMLIGALARRPRWRLTVPAVLMSLMLLAVGTYPVRIGDPTGRRDLAPRSVAEIKSSYPMLGGEQLLNFSGVNFAGRTVHVAVDQGAGHLRITVPANINVVIDARGRFGELCVFGDSYSGVENRHQDTYPAQTGIPVAGTLELDLRLIAGQMQIVRR
ncbi:MAG: cell wall-active antibiotics response protein, partial [Frankiaceae bacterium]|nr:cell wall-active antibiotics response protein [Frankiaceae bacterium]